MIRKVLITVLAMLALIMVGCGNDIVNKSIEQAKVAIESKDYDKGLASLELALDEEKDNEEANKLHSIVDAYKQANKLADENKVKEAKEMLDAVNRDYINYAIKDDIDALKSQIDNNLKEVENIEVLLREAENMFNNKQYTECKTHIYTNILGSEGNNIEPNKYATEEQKAKAEELAKRSDEAIDEIEAKRIAEEKKKQEEAKKVEKDKKSQQSSVKKYYVPHLNKELTMDEMFNEYDKITIPFDYVDDNGITYMFNPGSVKPTEPTY